MKYVSRVLGTTLLSSLLIPTLFAQAVPSVPLPQGVQFITSVEGITEYSLPNGLHVLLFPDASKSTITVNITYKVGSRQESYGETGMAHLLEHMLFKGTPAHTNIPKELNDRGAHFNASTNFDRTNFFEALPASDENLKWMLSFEADRMINSYVAQKDLDSEMTVVRNEFEMGENNPNRVLDERMMETAYIAHAYHRPVIGFRSDIEGVPIEHLQAFYHKYYQPDDAVLTVAGNFNPSSALAAIVGSFGTIPAPQRKLQSSYTVEPVQDGMRSTTLTRVGDIQITGSMFHIPASSDPDYPALSLLAEIMGDAPTGRLYKALVDSGKASNVYTECMQAHDPGLWMAFATVRKDDKLAEATDILHNTLESFSRTEPTSEELERARASLLKQKNLALANSDNLGMELSEWIASGDWRLFFLDRDRIQKVTAKDVQRVAAKYLITSNRTDGFFEPAPQQPLRAEIPAVSDLGATLHDYRGGAAVEEGEVFDATPENIEKRTVRSSATLGLKLALLEKKTRGNLVSATIVIHFGNEKTLENTDALGEFTADMLQRGTTTHTRQQIQDELDRRKAVLNVYADAGGVHVGITTTRDNLSTVLDLVAEMLRHPSFPQNELDTLKQEKLAMLESQAHDPQAVAALYFRRSNNPYPASSPLYLPTIEEKIAEVKTVTPAAMATYHSLYNAQNADITVVGDFDGKRVSDQINSLFGDWKGAQPFRRIQSAYFDVPAQRKVIEIPDKQNAIYLAGINVSMRDDDPDYPALLMAVQMMGGGMLHSRLADRIRGKDGLSYSVGTVLNASSSDHAGNLSSYAIFAPQNLSRLEQDYREEWGKAVTSGFTQEELDAARTGWLRSRTSARGQDNMVASKLAAYLFLDRTYAFDSRLEKAVSAVTPEQATVALRKYADPKKMTVVTSGTFAPKQ